MDSKTYTITLADGTVLDNLKLNGNNFISNTPINADIFDENCYSVIISDGENSETYNNMELVQITEQEPGKYWFVLRELSASEYVADLARNYTNEKLNSLPRNAPTKTVTFDGGIYSVGNDVVNGQVSVVLRGRTATNLVKNGSFENDSTNWDNIGGAISISNEKSYAGTKAVKKVLNNVANGHSQTINMIVGHKYYVSSMMYISSYTSGTPRMRLQNQGINVFANTTMLNVWQRLSTIIDNSVSTETVTFVEPVVATLTLYTDAVMAIDLTETFGAGNEPTKEQCDQIFTNWFDGTKSTNSVRIKSVGKNLWTKGEIKTGHDAMAGYGNHGMWGEDNSVILPQSGASLSNRLKLPNIPLKIVIQLVNSSGIAFRIYNAKTSEPLYSENKTRNAGVNIINIPALGETDVRIAFGAYNNANTIKNIMIMPADVDESYEPYKESIVNVNLPEPLRSVPSANDEVNVTSGVKTQRVSGSDYVLQATDISNGVDIGDVYKYTISSVKTKFTNVKMLEYEQTVFFNNLSLAYLASYTNNSEHYYCDASSSGGTGSVYLFINKTKVADNTALALVNYFNSISVSLTYQLATPIVTKLPAQAPLQVFENGTVYIEPVGDPSESTLPTVELTVPIGAPNKFGSALHDYEGAAADWVLNDSEQKCLILVATNSGGNANIILPKISGLVYLVDNKTDYNIVCKSVGDVAGTTILSGNSGLIYNI